MASTRILLANHHPLIRSSLRLLLERESGFRVVGEAANGREAVVLADYQHPDVVLLEVKLPHLNGIAAAREIAAKGSLPRMLFVTPHTDEGYVLEAFKAGARGYVMGDAALADLVHAIHVVASGRFFLSPALSRHFLEGQRKKPGEQTDLSEFQKELCCLLAAGYDEQEVAKHRNTNFHQLQADFRAMHEALERREVPEVLVKSIRENERFLEQAGS